MSLSGKLANFTLATLAFLHFNIHVYKNKTLTTLKISYLN